MHSNRNGMRFEFEWRPLEERIPIMMKSGNVSVSIATISDNANNSIPRKSTFKSNVPRRGSCCSSLFHRHPSERVK